MVFVPPLVSLAIAVVEEMFNITSEKMTEHRRKNDRVLLAKLQTELKNHEGEPLPPVPEKEQEQEEKKEQ